MWTAKEAGPCHKFLSVATHQRGKDWRLEVGGGEGGERKERVRREGRVGGVQRAENKIHKILLMTWGCSQHRAKGSSVLPAQKWQKSCLSVAFFFFSSSSLYFTWLSLGCGINGNTKCLYTLSKMPRLETGEED